MDQRGDGKGRAERAHPRRKVFQPARLHVGARPARAHLLDISLGGARLHCTVPCMPGERIEIAACSLTARGRVMWRRGDRMGVRFDRLLGEEEMLSLLG